MSQPTLEELAKRGDTNAIATLLNHAFERKGVTVKAAIKNDSLNIIVEAVETPNKQESVAFIRDLITRLQLERVERVNVYGRQPGDDIPDWHQTFVVVDVSATLNNGKSSTEEPFSFFSFAKMIGGIGESISHTTSQAGKAVVETAAGVGEVVGNTTLGTGKVLVDIATGVGKAVSDTVFHTGKAVVETAAGVGGAIAGVGGAIGNNASQAGKAAVKTAVGMGGSAAKHSYQVLSQITEFVAGTPILRKVVDQVDLVKAEAAVKRLKQKYPNEMPRQLAHRFMVEKAVYSPASLAVIKANIKSPPPLDQLLAQLNRDFAMPLLAQCERVVQRDGATTAEEAKIIEKISQKFEIDLNAMKEQLVAK